MSEPLSRLYDLALRALDGQERRADTLRARLGPTLASAALGVTLLSGPLVAGAHPTTLLGKLALVLAVGGLVITVSAAFRILWAQHPSDAVLDPRGLLDELAEADLLYDETSFYTEMITRLDDAQKRDRGESERLATAFTAMLGGILVMLCGLALAALVG